MAVLNVYTNRVLQRRNLISDRPGSGQGPGLPGSGIELGTGQASSSSFSSSPPPAPRGRGPGLGRACATGTRRTSSLTSPSSSSPTRGQGPSTGKACPTTGSRTSLGSPVDSRISLGGRTEIGLPISKNGEVGPRAGSGRGSSSSSSPTTGQGPSIGGACQTSRRWIGSYNRRWIGSPISKMGLPINKMGSPIIKTRCEAGPSQGVGPDMGSHMNIMGSPIDKNGIAGASQRARPGTVPTTNWRGEAGVFPAPGARPTISSQRSNKKPEEARWWTRPQGSGHQPGSGLEQKQQEARGGQLVDWTKRDRPLTKNRSCTRAATSSPGVRCWKGSHI